MSKVNNADSIKQLAADLYGSADVAAKDYTADYKKIAAEGSAAQKKAAEDYNAAIDILKKSNDAAYGAIGEDVLELSRRRINAPDEQIVQNGSGIYGTAAQDASVSAQILHDNAIGNSYNDITAAQKAEADRLLLSKNLAELQRKANDAQDLADLTQQQIQAQRAENQSAAAALGTASQYLAAAQDDYNAQNQSEIALAEIQKQNAYQNALNEVNTFGKVLTKAAAEALGVPIGTSAAYAKVNRISSGGGGGGGPRQQPSTKTLKDYENTFIGYRADGMDSATAYKKIMTEAKNNGESNEMILDVHGFATDYIKYNSVK